MIKMRFCFGRKNVLKRSDNFCDQNFVIHNLSTILRVLILIHAEQ